MLIGVRGILLIGVRGILMYIADRSEVYMKCEPTRGDFSPGKICRV